MRSLFDLFSFQRTRRVRLSGREYLFYGGAGLLLLALVIAYGVEIRHFKDLLHPGRLMGYSALAGLLLGIGLGFVLRAALEKRRGRRFEPLERVQIHIITFLLCMFFAPLFASWLNRSLASKEVVWLPFVFYREEAFYSNRYGLPKGEKPEATGYHLYLFDQDIEETHLFTLPVPVAKGLAQGADIKLPFHRGALGVYILDKDLLTADNQ